MYYKNFKVLNINVLRSVIFLISMTTSVLYAQKHTCILGRPTNSSVTVSTLFDQQVAYTIEYGASSGNYTSATAPVTVNPQTPHVQDLTKLQPNQRYFYRLKFYKPGTTIQSFSPEYTFHTQRAPGSAFTFVIEADEHLYDKKGIRSLYEITIANQAADKPDFIYSLGDMFGDDHTPETTTSQEMKELHMDYLQYLGRICHSAPFFFCLGNHEGENGYYLQQNNGQNIAVYGSQWRKYFYPNPFPNDFYTGNDQQEGYGIGYPENYYAYTWGDVQFIVLDVYRHCDINEKPKGWDWTLGEDQFMWLKKTLEESTSKYKFVIAHHTRGQGRGGIKTARAYEWGGYNGDNSTQYQFDSKRPGWGLPIHQLMVKHGVDVYFQGHDHVYAHEVLDGIVYQTLPMPSDSTYRLGIEANGDAFEGVILEGCGHLRVTVDANCATVDFVQSWLPKDTLSGEHKNREVAHSFTIGECVSGVSDKEKSEGNSLLIQPNPANEAISVNTDLFLQRGGIARITDINGRKILTQEIEAGNEAIVIPTLSFSNGIYYLQMTSGNQSATGKFIVTHR